jgi:tetrahydrodipicolinate N-succinyltransferase
MRAIAVDDRAARLASPVRTRIEAILERWPSTERIKPHAALVDEARNAVADLIAALEAGTVRAAEPDATARGRWRVNRWVKAGILLGFRLPDLREWRAGTILAARDRAAFGLLDVLDGHAARAAEAAGAPWRIVPGGSTAVSYKQLTLPTKA